MEYPGKSSRAGWLLALAIVAAPLLLVASSWDEITAGSETGSTAAASSSDVAQTHAFPAAGDSQASSSGSDAPAAPTGPGSRPLRNPRGYVALTYDDGPNPEFTPKLLDTLAAYDAPANFFVQGNHTHDTPELVQRELDEGHVVGNHSYDHFDLTAIDSGLVRRQLLGTNEEFDKIDYQPSLYRPPYDRHDPSVDAIAEDLGLTRASWTYRHDPKDWEAPSGEGKTAGQVCTAVVNQAQPSDVILMHDRFQGSVDAAPCIIRGLREAGLEPGRLEVADKPSPKNGDSYIQVVR